MIFKEFDIEDRIHCNIAIAIAGAGLVSAASTAYGASKAAEAQTNASNAAQQTIRDQYKQTREDLSPYRAAGESSLATLQSRLPFLTSPITMDQATLEKTPGYQFTKTQGLKAVQNSAAARGLSASGAAQKGAANFVTGLADQTYKDQFNLENINRTNEFNRLQSLVQTGGNAAAQTGQFGSTAATGIASAQTGAGNAQAAAANATAAGINNGVNSLQGYAIYKGLYGDNGGGGGGGNNWGGNSWNEFNNWAAG